MQSYIVNIDFTTFEGSGKKNQLSNLHRYRSPSKAMYYKPKNYIYRYREWDFSDMVRGVFY